MVTSRWSAEHVARWDKLIGTIDEAIARNNAKVDALKRAQEEEAARVARLEAERDRLAAELERAQAAMAQEQKRQDLLLSEFRNQEAAREQRFVREMEEARARFEKEAEAKAELALLRARHDTELRTKSLRSAKVVLAMLASVLAAVVGAWVYSSRGREASVATPSSAAPAGASVPAAVVTPAPAPLPTEQSYANPEGPVTNAVISSTDAEGKWLRPCLAGTYNVIVASGFRDAKTADVLRAAYAREHPEFEFQVVSTVSARGGSEVMQAIFAGQGLSRAEATDLLAAIRKADFITNAYITPQTFDCAGSKPSLRVRKAPPKASGSYGAKY